MAIDKEKEKLFKQVRTKLGGGVRKIQLTDDQLCDLLEIAIGHYAERVQNFMIQNNWANLYGKSLTNTDLAYAMSVRTMDLAKDYSQYFSKQVGLQQTGNFELKKDFITLESGKQVYVIPAGREVNRVMWVTPPVTDPALFGAYGGMQLNMGGGAVAQTGIGAALAFGGVTGAHGMAAGMWCLPAADVSVLAMDMKYKSDLLHGPLTYKVTAGPDGTHLLHLLSTPGSRLTFGGHHHLGGCQVWYTYYDVNPTNVDECRKANPDVLLTPDQIPLEEMDYAFFNAPTKAIIRQLLIAEAAETLGLKRGTFSGDINFLASPLKMDYQMYISMGQNIREKVLQELDDRLQKMSPVEIMKQQAEITQNLTEVKKGVPLPIFVK